MVSFTTFRGTPGTICKSQTSKGDLTGDQVLVKITASGLCGSDLHYRHVDMVLGHEGIGVVEKTGPGIKYLKKGDRVGWGYQHDSCGHCQSCLTGAETYCAERKMYGYVDLDQGSFADKAVWREAFLFKLPNSITDRDAAPLMCGGASVFNALHVYDTQPTETVGVVGVGGLGHLAIQFAASMGCNVVVFSSNASKKGEALKLGAHEFITTEGKKDLQISNPIDRLLVTTSKLPDWTLYMPLLASGATIHPLSIAFGDFAVPYMDLLLKGITVQGSIVASRYVQQRMLSFAALHKIVPLIQEFPMTVQGITEAMKKLEDGEIRYRAVLIPQKVADDQN